MRLEIEYAEVETIGGYWSISSPDEPGLNLGGTDLKALLASVPTAVEYLNKHNGTHWLEPSHD